MINIVIPICPETVGLILKLFPVILFSMLWAGVSFFMWTAGDKKMFVLFTTLWVVGDILIILDTLEIHFVNISLGCTP